jgi:5-methylcytosine-specific restriction endonuclease McrA
MSFAPLDCGSNHPTSFRFHTKRAPHKAQIIGMKAAQRARLFDDVYFRDGGCCVYCGIATRRPGRGVGRGSDLATLDHVVPRSLGGPLHRDNIALACSACNNERGTMDAEAFGVLKAASKIVPSV